MSSSVSSADSSSAGMPSKLSPTDNLCTQTQLSTHKYSSQSVQTNAAQTHKLSSMPKRRSVPSVTTNAAQEANNTYSLKVRSSGQARSTGNAVMAARWLGVQWDAICATAQLKPTITSTSISNKQGANSCAQTYMHGCAPHVCASRNAVLYRCPPRRALACSLFASMSSLM